MNFELQLNYYKDEDGEYTEPEPVNLSNLKEVFGNNWPNESYVEHLKLILIRSNERYLILRNCKKSVFEVYYTDDERNFFHKKSRIELVYDCSELFFDSRIDELKMILN